MNLLVFKNIDTCGVTLQQMSVVYHDKKYSRIKFPGLDEVGLHYFHHTKYKSLEATYINRTSIHFKQHAVPTVDVTAPEASARQGSGERHMIVSLETATQMPNK